jgi:hypothetical protein
MKWNVDKLRDDEHYYGDFGKQFLSNSDITALLTNPRDFKKSTPDNAVFAKGRYFHQLILEPKKAEAWEFVDVSSRNTKAYKEFCAANEMSFAMLEKEGEEIRSLVDVMLGNMELFDNIRHDKCEYEVPAIKEIAGEIWKGKADIVHPDMVIDLKTTGDINSFKWNAKKYNYDSQAFIYQEMFGKPLVFYVIDKSTGMLGVFEPTNDFIQSGESKVIRAVKQYRAFFGADPTEDIDTYFIHEYI